VRLGVAGLVVEKYLMVWPSLASTGFAFGFVTGLELVGIEPVSV